MQDVFIEYMVKRKNTPKTILAKFGVVAASLVAATVLLAVSGVAGPLSTPVALLAFGALYGGFILVTLMNVEFEYAVTNGEIDFDKIMARRKRRRIVTVNCRDAEAFGRYNTAEHAGKNYDTRIFACDDPASGDLWYLALRLKGNGNTLIVFNANEKILSAIKPFLPGHIAREAYNEARAGD